MPDASPPSPPPPRVRVAAYMLASDDAVEAKAQREKLIALQRSLGTPLGRYEETRRFKRPKWDLLAERARRGEIDVVCVLSLAEVSQNEGSLARAIVALGVPVIAADGVTVDPANPLVRWLATGRERRQKHTHRTIERRRERGERIGQIPFGWQLGSDDVLVPCPAEQATIARAIELRKLGTKFQQIAEMLNKEGHRARGGGRVYRGQASRWQRAKQG